MRLGARWAAGSAPHRSVPSALHPLIAEQEAAHPGASAWTLTWLEGRPRCALDELVTVTLDAAGRAVVATDAARPDVSDDSDDDWLG